MTQATSVLQRVGQQLVPEAGKAAGDGAAHAIQLALENVSQTATDAVLKACQPLLAGLAGVAAQELTGSGVVAAAAWGAPAGVASSVGVAGLSSTVAPAGNNIPFSVQPPSLGLRYCVVLNGIFPSQN